jgi:hypothetical protein
MAVDIRPDTLQRLQTELMVVRAQRTDLQFKVRQRQFIDRAKLREATIRRAMRIRDQLTTAPARHAPLLAAEFGLQMEHVHAALTEFMTTTLRWIAAREFEAPIPPPSESAEKDSVSQI